MINNKSFEMVHEFLNFYGGLHEQPIKTSGKLNVDQELPYYSKLMVMARKLQVPVSTHEMTYNLAHMLILILELDYIRSIFSKTYIPYWSATNNTGVVKFNGIPSQIISVLDSIMYTRESSMFQLTGTNRLIGSISAFMLNLDKQLCKRPEGNTTDFINKSIQTVCWHNKSKLHLTFDSAQQALAIHYLNSMGVEASTANDVAYLQYIDKKQADNSTVRYYGEVMKLDGDTYITIMMRPKTGAIPAETKYYQIRPADINDTKIYALCEVNRLSNTISVIPGPVTKEIRF